MSDMRAWYLSDDRTLEPEGPLSTEDMIKRLRLGQLKADDFVYKKDSSVEPSWRRIWEFQEFHDALRSRPVCPLPKELSKGRSKEIQFDLSHVENIKGEYGIENIYRRHPRAPLTCPVVVHDQKNVIFAGTTDLSEMGVSITVSQGDFLKRGDEVVLTLRAPDPIGTFSCRAVVMRLSQEGRTLGLYFLSLNPRMRRRIAQFVFEQLNKMVHLEKSS